MLSDVARRPIRNHCSKDNFSTDFVDNLGDRIRASILVSNRHDLVIHYREGKLSTVYYGAIGLAAKAARYYDHISKYELDIAKVRRLSDADTSADT
jgi:hypothetical protein